MDLAGGRVREALCQRRWRDEAGVARLLEQEDGGPRICHSQCCDYIILITVLANLISVYIGAGQYGNEHAKGDKHENPACSHSER